jgi:hypothetical protein
MPKTTIHNNNSIVFGQNDIRFTRQVFHMKSVPETSCKKRFAYNHFWTGVFTPNPTHDFAAFGFGKNIRHGPKITTISWFFPIKRGSKHLKVLNTSIFINFPP